MTAGEAVKCVATAAVIGAAISYLAIVALCLWLAQNSERTEIAW